MTHLDGLLARSAFHHSVNYRSVVVMGRAEMISDPSARRVALERLVEGIVPGRTRDARPPDDRELRATMVLALPLAECSVKVRTGGPLDDEEDMGLPVWAGVVPLTPVYGAPVADPAQQPALRVPAYATDYRRPGAA